MYNPKLINHVQFKRLPVPWQFDFKNTSEDDSALEMHLLNKRINALSHFGNQIEQLIIVALTIDPSRDSS